MSRYCRYCYCFTVAHTLHLAECSALWSTRFRTRGDHVIVRSTSHSATRASPSTRCRDLLMSRRANRKQCGSQKPIRIKIEKETYIRAPCFCGQWIGPHDCFSLSSLWYFPPGVLCGTCLYRRTRSWICFYFASSSPCWLDDNVISNYIHRWSGTADVLSSD